MLLVLLHGVSCLHHGYVNIIKKHTLYLYLIQYMTWCIHICVGICKNILHIFTFIIIFLWFIYTLYYIFT